MNDLPPPSSKSTSSKTNDLLVDYVASAGTATTQKSPPVGFKAAVNDDDDDSGSLTLKKNSKVQAAAVKSPLKPIPAPPSVTSTSSSAMPTGDLLDLGDETVTPFASMQRETAAARKEQPANLENSSSYKVHNSDFDDFLNSLDK